jgi:5'-deoxynucleotidase YfbR-like HD superfamily hydrolase
MVYAEAQVNREQMKRSCYLAGKVMRYHAWPTLNTQTVADHSWRVATLIVEVFGAPRAEVIIYALYHDCGEMFSGDLPFMVKTAIPGLADAMKQAEAHGLEQLGIALPVLSKLERAQVKIADLLEMHEFGAMEVLLGNQFGIAVRDDTLAEARRVAMEHNIYPPVQTWIHKQGIRNGKDT